MEFLHWECVDTAVTRQRSSHTLQSQLWQVLLSIMMVTVQVSDALIEYIIPSLGGVITHHMHIRGWGTDEKGLLWYCSI